MSSKRQQQQQQDGGEGEEQERAEFGRFAKYLCIRLAQALVQSRSGQSVRTTGASRSEGTDWFNVRVEELGEVTRHLRAVTRGRYPPSVAGFSVEFSLRTAQRESLLLECWTVGFRERGQDPAVSVRGQLYHQMSALLKSALAAARLTPAYRYYARRQAPDTFVICYRIFHGECDVLTLGEGSRTIPLGFLLSPFGTLTLSLSFRTKMVVSNSNGENETAAGAEEEEEENSGSASTGGPSVVFSSPSKDNMCQPLPSSSSSPLVRGGMGRGSSGSLSGCESTSPSDYCQSTFSTSPASIDIPWFQGPPPPSPVMFRLDEQGRANASANIDVPSTSATGETACSSLPSQDQSNEANASRVPQQSLPFAALLSSAHSAPVIRPAVPPSATKGSTAVRFETRTEVEEEDDEEEERSSSDDDSFVKILPSHVLSNAEDANRCDLGAFVRQCKTAPPKLRSFEAAPLHGSQGQEAATRVSNSSLEQIPEQLTQFETQQVAFDRFVSSLEAEEEEEHSDEDNQRSGADHTSDK